MWLSQNWREKAILIKSATRQTSASASAPTPQLGLSPLILALLKPVETESGIPYEQMDAYRRKKMKKKGPSL